ncbi:MAG: hypothetical protein U5L96_12565 [Owenweeksia sp.]|nr:hypothetical protein [Owenweeksia sp.]
MQKNTLNGITSFLLADNTDLPDDIFIVHTDFPRFIWKMNEDEVEWLDDLKGEEQELVKEVANLLEAAEAFYNREIERLETGLYE